jgi:hypothetical protein
MDAQTTLTQARPRAAKTANIAEPVARPLTTRPKVHHLISYGSTSRDDAAAFAGAKILLESAIAAEREPRIGAANLKKGARRRHYIVRLIASGDVVVNSANTGLDAGFLPVGTMSVRKSAAGMEDARTNVLVGVCPTQLGSVDLPAYSGLTRRTGRTFDFTVVDGNVTHCVWWRR